jgi:CIC family chloride channel protein
MSFFVHWRHPGTWKLFRLDDRLLLIIFGMVVGVCSGLASVALNRSLAAMLEWLHPFRHIWWGFLLPGLGAALSSIFLNKIMKEGAGHGVPEVIYSISRHRGLLRFRTSFSRLISSCLTIGSGGSAGPEAPVVISGAAIGSNIAKLFSLNDRQRVALVGCGAAGAISAIFNAPIAGMVFSMEVILNEWSAVNIIPVGIASVAGTEISRILQGNQIPFSHHQFNIGFLDITACLGLAVVTAIASILFSRMINYVHDRVDKVSLPVWVRAGAGGCVVGFLGFFLPVVLGEGYTPVRAAIEGTFTPGLAIVGLATLGKIVATALTLGSGGSGGIFAPCLVVGSFAGLTYHRALAFLWPHVAWANEGCFALIGMAGLMSGVLQAPLTGIFLIVEVTGGYEVILPLIIVAAISTTICHYVEPASFYLKDLVEKGTLCRPRTDAGILANLCLEDLVEKDCLKVVKDMLLRDFLEVIKESPDSCYAVEDEETGDFVGIISLDEIRPYLPRSEKYDTITIGQIMDIGPVVASHDDELSEILHRMEAQNMNNIPVVAHGKFIGILSKTTLLEHYREELINQTHYHKI